MEEVINSIRRASELVQNLQQDLPNLANQPETLSLSIDQITQAFTDAKEKLLLISRHTQTSESPPMLLHETTPQQPQMDATLIQEWLRSSHAVTMDQMFQMQLASMAGREVEDSERTIGSEGDQGQGIHASSSRPRRRYLSISYVFHLLTVITFKKLLKIHFIYWFERFHECVIKISVFNRREGTTEWYL